MELPTAIGYVRVSTGKQAETGVSLAAQEARIEAWAKAHDYNLITTYKDAGISGSRADTRPGLCDALEAVCEHKAALVVYSMSRLARSTPDTLRIAERIDKAGADLVSLSERIDTTTASGRMVFRMMAVLNEFERDLIAERTSAALQHKKKSGKAYTRAVFGYRKTTSGELVPDEHEQHTLKWIAEMRASGAGYCTIANALNEAGACTKTRGSRWYGSTVRNICLNSLHEKTRAPAD